jgi:pimeloyl-ACP methyl ester carboxylesterase
MKWSGEGAPGYGYDGDKYSWVHYASQQGYPTLAIDRLGYGLSDHPDPILHVQFPTHAEVAHSIVKQVRAGTSPFPRAFDQVIYVGHSFGSLVGNVFNEKYPDDVNATILTGWSSNFVLAGVPIALGLVVLPAQLLNPTEFGDLPIGYVEVSSEQGEINAFYYTGAYDPAMEAVDFASRQTIALGELATFPTATTEATGYTAPIFVVTGDEDAIFCSPAMGLLPPSCGTGPANVLEVSGTLYPHASVYDYYILPDAGHCWQLHYAAQNGFSASHDWLAKQGF